MRQQERNALDERMFEDRLRAHCVHCHTPSVQLGLRPGCPNCEYAPPLPSAFGTAAYPPPAWQHRVCAGDL